MRSTWKNFSARPRATATLPLVLTLIASLSGCTRPVQVTAQPVQAERKVDVLFITDEADAALAIVRAHRAGDAPSARQWSALFRSQGYQSLKEREAAVGRSFTDSSFRNFLISDSLADRLLQLDHAVLEMKRANIDSAASLALAYLPAGTVLNARLYIEIKPAPNTFVFTGQDGIPSIFIHVQTSQTRAQLQNTLAHELHHIGTENACRTTRQDDSTLMSPAVRTLFDYLGAFDEGRAMLAAAGGPDVHPHADDSDSLRAVWDRDVAKAPADMKELSAFFNDVIAGRMETAESVRVRGNSYFGYQGPWYTVGWLMSSVVERQLGRPVLVGTLCKPALLLARYNQAATASNMTRGTTLPVWPSALIESLAGYSNGTGNH